LIFWVPIKKSKPRIIEEIKETKYKNINTESKTRIIEEIKETKSMNIDSKIITFRHTELISNGSID
jgi:predicted ribosome-associated RNA-binding protein Tma20